MKLAENDNWFKYEKKPLRFPLHVAVADEYGQKVDADIEFNGDEMDAANLRWVLTKGSDRKPAA